MTMDMKESAPLSSAKSKLQSYMSIRKEKSVKKMADAQPDIEDDNI